MNKLMIAATLALTMGAYVNAQQGGCEYEPTPKNCALVYNFALNAKTTAAKGKNVKGGFCEYDEFLCWRVKGKQNLKGFVAYCGCDCDGVQSDAIISLWNQKAKTIWFLEDAFTFNTFWRIGGPSLSKSTLMELEWVIGEGQLVGQGYGTWNANAGRLQKANGVFIGYFPAPEFANKKAKEDDDCWCVPGVWICDEGWGYDEAVEATIAFGNWNMTYNANASVRFANYGELPYPNWFWNFW